MKSAQQRCKFEAQSRWCGSEYQNSVHPCDSFPLEPSELKSLALSWNHWGCQGVGSMALLFTTSQKHQHSWTHVLVAWGMELAAGTWKLPNLCNLRALFPALVFTATGLHEGKILLQTLIMSPHDPIKLAEMGNYLSSLESEQGGIILYSTPKTRSD